MCLSISTQMYAATSASQLPPSVLQEGSSHVPPDTDIDNKLVPWLQGVLHTSTQQQRQHDARFLDLLMYTSKGLSNPYPLHSLPLVLNPALP